MRKIGRMLKKVEVDASNNPIDMGPGEVDNDKE